WAIRMASGLTDLFFLHLTLGRGGKFLSGCFSWTSQGQRRDQIEPLFQQPGHQEMSAHPFSAPPAGVPAHSRVPEQHADVVSGLLDVPDQEAGLAVDNLVPDAADIAAYYRPALPHRLRYRKLEYLALHLVQHDD